MNELLDLLLQGNGFILTAIIGMVVIALVINCIAFGPPWINRFPRE